MKKNLLLFAAVILICAKLYAMEAPPQCMPEGKHEQKPLFKLYDDENAVKDFHSKIEKIIKDSSDDTYLVDELSNYAMRHPVDAKTFWQYNKGRVIGYAKAIRDVAHAELTGSTARGYLDFAKLYRSRLIQANINLGYLKDFEEGISLCAKLGNQPTRPMHNTFYGE